MGRFELGEAGRLIYDFIWSEVCDWYIELAKPRLYNKEDPEARATAQHVLAEVLTSAMKLLHPYMPFITEEIYQCLPHESNSIMIAPWPIVDERLFDDKAETGMTAIQLAGIGFAVAAVLLLFRVTKPQKRKPNFASFR